MPRTSKKEKKHRKSSGSPGEAAATSTRGNGESPPVRTLQQNVVPNGAAGLAAGTSASPREQTKVVGARMSGVKHSGLLAKDAKRRCVVQV